MKQGETGIWLIFVLQDENGNPFDLTNAVGAKLYIKKGNNVISRDMEIYSAAEGKVRYVTQNDDLDIGDINYIFQVAVDFSDGSHLVSDVVVEHVETTLEVATNGS